MQEISGEIRNPASLQEYEKPGQADSQATLGSQDSMSQIAPFSSPIDRQALISSWVSLRLDLVAEQLRQCDPSTSFYKLISAGTQAYASTEFFARHHLRTIIYETFIYAVGLGYLPTPPQHTDLVIFMAPLSMTLALSILRVIDQSLWTAQAHAIAYHLEWSSVSIDISQSESDITVAYRLLNDDDQIETASKQTSFIEAAQLPDPQVDLQEELKNRHWSVIKKRFEEAWKGHIVGKEMTRSLKQDSIVLLTSFITLSIHFEQYECAWEWAEKTMLNEWKVMVWLLRLCRKAAVGEDKEIWRARAWVLYKLVKDRGIVHTPFYTEFMGETEPILECLQTLPRIISEMIEYCGESFFPIPDSTLAPLLEVCWKCRNEPKLSWESSFRKIFEVYVLYKFYKTRRGSTILLENHGYYFSADRFVKILSLCTFAGYLDEFEVLNKDLLDSKADEEFVLKVKRGYGLFIGQVDETVQDLDKETDDQYVVTKLRFDKETLERLNQHLLRYLCF